MFPKPYYPKPPVGVPFTPVPGPRLLVKPGPHGAAVRRALADSLKQVGGRWAVLHGAGVAWAHQARKTAVYCNKIKLQEMPCMLAGLGFGSSSACLAGRWQAAEASPGCAVGSSVRAALSS